MKAKKLKEILDSIPDDAWITFEYSNFFFEGIHNVFHGKEIRKEYSGEDFDIDEIRHKKNDYVISFSNSDR